MIESLWALRARGWRRALQIAALSSLMWGSTIAAPADASFDIGPVPPWVRPLAPDLAAQPPAEQVAGGVHHLLVDHQLRVEAGDRVSYRHFAAKALNEQGVESIANIDVRFDPSFQRLTLHAINVRRGTETIAKLERSAVRLLQRESELEALIYDGSRTASVFLEDVRVGDVVEYVYSLRGHNPVFGGLQFGRIDLQWSVPVARVHARLLWPQERQLHIRYRNDAAAATRVEGPSHQEYQWDLRDVAARRVEQDAPRWFDPYLAVEWGEFQDWRAVVGWALPLYRLPDGPSPGVRAVAADISAAHAQPEQRLLAALRYVQSEVRYLGIEVGAGSHAPSAPDLVLKRRFGDCKDKTMLTVALLQALGIEAQPALVHTEVRQGIADRQPSPAAFNHVIVKARLGASDLWLDPTRPPQAGGLAQLGQADFGLALVVDRRTTDLSAMAGESARMHRREVRAELDSRAGLDKPVGYTVTTVVQGAAADALRGTLSAQSPESLQRQYTNFYASYFDELSVGAPMKVVDDRQANRITVTEQYVIGKFWRRSDRHPRLEADIAVPELTDYLRQPADPVRQSPLALSHPVDLMQVTRVLLPSKWDLKPEEIRIEDPAFEVHRSEAWEGGDTLVLTDRFTSRRPEIPAADVPRYAGNLEKARRALGYSLYQYDPAGAGDSAPHWLPAVAATLSALGFLALARLAWRWDPLPSPADPMRPPAPSGLGGWLILAGLLLAAGAFKTSRWLWEVRHAFDTDSWLRLTSVGGENYHALWAPVLLFELVAQIGMLIALGLVAALFFKKRSSLPHAFTWLLIAAFAVTVVDLALLSQLPAQTDSAPTFAEAARQGIFGLIWIAYFQRSQRVRCTFVRRLRASEVGAGGSGQHRFGHPPAPESP